MAELDSFPNQQPQDSDEVVAAHDSNGDGTLDDTVNWTWSGMKAALGSAGFARLSENETITGRWQFNDDTVWTDKDGPRWEVGGSLRSLLRYEEEDNGLYGFMYDSSGEFNYQWLEVNDDGSVRLKGNTLYVDSNNVGIGGTSPSHALDTAGVIRAQERLITDFSDPSTFSAREVKSGTSAPSDSEGKNGDIYIQTN